MNRANLASSFVEHPYWALMCNMLMGTTKSEFEEMLTSDDRLPLARASVVVCRKVMRMPFLDIEQGKRAVAIAERFGMQESDLSRSWASQRKQ